MHSAVAHAYRAPGSDGADFSSLAENEYFADVPTDTLRMASPAAGAPADAVPQYWHRAAGFDDMFIAHAESRQRVKFAREQVVTAFAVRGTAVIIAVKNMFLIFISLYVFNYIKKAVGAQREK